MEEMIAATVQQFRALRRVGGHLGDLGVGQPDQELELDHSPLFLGQPRDGHRQGQSVVLPQPFVRPRIR
jgi:hypothetical protein